MGRSRYKIYEPTHPHFVTCTILHWIPLFDGWNEIKKSTNDNTKITNFWQKVYYLGKNEQFFINLNSKQAD